MRVVGEDVGLQPVTIAMAFVYFEKLVLQGRLNKQNRYVGVTSHVEPDWTPTDASTMNYCFFINSSLFSSPSFLLLSINVVRVQL